MSLKLAHCAAGPPSAFGALLTTWRAHSSLSAWKRMSGPLWPAVGYPARVDGSRSPARLPPLAGLPGPSMTFEQFAAIVHHWQARMTAEQVHPATESLLRRGVVDGLPWRPPRDSSWEPPVDEVLAMVATGEVVPMPDRKVEPAASPPKLPRAPRTRKPDETDGPTSAPVPSLRGRSSKRAQALVREHLAHGPKPGAEIEAAAEAAAIPERTLIAAASVLGVRTRRGQWWLPGQRQDRQKLSL
jgi:hypothetical protein